MKDIEFKLYRCLVVISIVITVQTFGLRQKRDERYQRDSQFIQSLPLFFSLMVQLHKIICRIDLLQKPF